MTLLIALPLLLSAFAGFATLIFAFQRKLQAQTVCVTQGLRLQASLKKNLQRLIELNPKAKALRTRRAKADLALKSALASGHPGAIAAAKAVRTAVILEQLAHQGRQQALLNEAKVTRLKFSRELHHSLRNKGFGSVRSHAAVPGLAVTAHPAVSLSPDYLPSPGFKNLQSQSFEFKVSLTPNFFEKNKIAQTTHCSITLEGDGNKWSTKILAGSLWSKPRLFSPSW